LEKEEEAELAEEAWRRASELIPHKDIVKRSAQASYEQKRYTRERLSLEILLDKSPDDQEILTNFVHCLFNLRDFPAAIDPLKRLITLQPKAIPPRVWLTQAYMRIAKVKDAIDALDQVLETGDEVGFDLYQLYDQLLRADGRPKDSLKKLKTVLPRFKEEPRFLLTLMHAAYAAGDEKLAQETFVRLERLRQTGLVPEELMQTGTLEQLLEMNEKYVEDKTTLLRKVVEAMWAWKLHTQELKWVSELPLQRASLSIYSTNSFRFDAGSAPSRLKRIAPPKKQPTVVDLSAVLTLFNLSILEETAVFFEAIYLPLEYATRRVTEADKFGNHQPLRKITFETIRRKINSHQIEVIESKQSSDFYLSEHTEAKENLCRLQNLLPVLKTANKIDLDDETSLLKVAHKPATPLELELGDRLVVELQTLRILLDQPFADDLVGCFHFCITSEDLRELNQTLDSYDQINETISSHNAMWAEIDRLVDNGCIIWKSASDKPDDEPSEFIPAHDSLSSYELAARHQMPLLADDRALLSIAFNDDSTPYAFCTGDLIDAMRSSGNLSIEEAARHYLDLIKWRYRFLVLPADLLHEFAVQSASNVPGSSLIEVANYIHECFCDPGIPAHFDASAPSIPLAMKYATEWTTTIIDFLVLVLNDTRFSDQSAFLIVRWAGEELLPPFPRVLSQTNFLNIFPPIEEQSLLHFAMVHFTAVKDVSRANLGLKTLGEVFGLTDDEFISVAAKANYVAS